MERSVDSGPAALSDYLEVLRRRKWIVVQTTVVVAIVAVVLSLRQEKVYEASAAMLIGSQDIGAAVTGLPLTSTSSDPIRRVQTQARLARVPEVARRAVVRAGIEDVTQNSLLRDSRVKGSPDSDFLTFVVSGSNADEAAVLATAYANAYAGFRLELDTSTIKGARKELEAQISALGKAGDRKSALYGNLVTKAQQLRTMELLQQRNSVVQRAEPGTQVAPAPMRSALLGIGVGFLFGIALAFLWDALDRRVRSESEIEDQLGLPILSRLPEPPRHLRSGKSLAMLDEPGDVHGEAVRRLRTNVEFANLDRTARTIMVTSSVEREGKSTTVANLAVALARGGRNVVLVDLDLRQPTIAQLFGQRGAIGLTDVVLGKVMLDRAIVEISLRGNDANGANRGDHGADNGAAGAEAIGKLSVLPAGPMPASPGEFVGTLALARVIEQLRDQYELVLIDTPPIGIVGDAMTLSAHVDALIVVTRLGVLQRGQLHELCRELARSPARKLGIVVTGVEVTSSDGYGGYGYIGRGNATPQGDGTTATSREAARRTS